MVLLVDIGNTASKFASLERGKFSYLGRLYNFDISEEKISSLLGKLEVKEIYVSSVAPKILFSLENIFLNLYHLPTNKIDASYNDFITLNIDNKDELGPDLLCDIVAGANIYKSRVAIIDFGTATKVLFIDKNGIFNSCAIFPGYKKSKEILANTTELLPEVKQVPVKKISECHNTIDVINSSTYYSQIDSINGIISRYENEVGYKLNRVYTGGNALPFINKLIKKDEYDEFLLLKGMALLIERRN